MYIIWQIVNLWIYVKGIQAFIVVLRWLLCKYKQFSKQIVGKTEKSKLSKMSTVDIIFNTILKCFP